MADEEPIELTLAEIDQRDRIIAQAAVETVKAQIVGWLRFQAATPVLQSDGEFRKTAEWLAREIESGAPERWAAEREGSR